MTSNRKEYFLIFDTNTLYQNYDKFADFTQFSFNATYSNVVGMIDQLDIYEAVSIVIPMVVWSESKKQIVEAYKTQRQDFQEKVNKRKFPDIAVVELPIENYEEYIQKRIDEYKVAIGSNVNRLIQLQIPSEASYQKLVTRAFDKRPPFEGKDKQSDKGFKDALLWEGILEFLQEHPVSDLILYTKDKIFQSEQIAEEFIKEYPYCGLQICGNENEVKQILQQWAKTIDEYSFISKDEYYPEDYETFDKINEWLYTDTATRQLDARLHDFIDDNESVRFERAELYNVISIENDVDEEEKHYYATIAEADVFYRIKKAGIVSNRINVLLDIRCDADGSFYIHECYKQVTSD